MVRRLSGGGVTGTIITVDGIPHHLIHEEAGLMEIAPVSNPRAWRYIIAIPHGTRTPFHSEYEEAE